MTVKIYLLRHGETDWSKAGKLQGRTDVPLNQEGIEQIGAAGEFLTRADETINVIISSPLARARESAEIIADRMGLKKDDIVIEPDFMERCFGAGEGLTREERDRKFSVGGYPGAESVEDLCKRVGAAFTKVINKYGGKTVLIVAHGSVLKAILTSATNGKYSYSEGKAAFGTGELCLLEYDGNESQIIYLKESGVDHA